MTSRHMSNSPRGELYACDDTEIVSMGVEKLYTDPMGFAKRDPEYFQFVCHILSM